MPVVRAQTECAQQTVSCEGKPHDWHKVMQSMMKQEKREPCERNLVYIKKWKSHICAEGTKSVEGGFETFLLNPLMTGEQEFS